MNTNDLLERVGIIAADFAEQRSERMKRRELDSKDFERLRDAGYLKLDLPAERGGFWSGARSSVRGYAEVIRTLATGDPFFPGGVGTFDIAQNDFLGFEQGPSVDMQLQWATYKDASDQTSLSRIWGGIHPPIDDIPGRKIGKKLGIEAFHFAKEYFYKDADNDGFYSYEDCDDTNPNINPNASEICNGIDDDCNEVIDDNIQYYTYYLDADGDGYGDLNSPSDFCEITAPDGYSNLSTDCDDTNAEINPSIQEIAGNGIDEDCNGEDLIEFYSIYPNPTNGELSIYITNQQNVNVNISPSNSRTLSKKSIKFQFPMGFQLKYILP